MEYYSTPTNYIYICKDFSFYKCEHGKSTSNYFIFLQLTGQWKGKSAGGCANNHDSYQHNPIYQVAIDNNSVDNHMMIELLGPK